jgi:hypothetical protein
MSVVYLLTGLRDARLFAEVLALAGDRSASIPARVVAFMTLAKLKMPPDLHVRFEDFVRGPDAKGIPSCVAGMSTHAREPRLGPVPLPEDFRAQIAEVTGRVRDDPAEPPEVRNAAACT